MVNLELAVRQFLTYCRAKQLSPDTIRWYVAFLKPLVARLYHRAIGDITVTDLRRYLIALSERTTRYHNARQRPEVEGGVTRTTYNNHVRALKVFFRWATREYSLAENPAADIKYPRPEQVMPRTIDLFDIKRLLDACENTPIGRRDRAIISFLIDSGCRSKGLLTLTLSRLDLRESVAIVREKGNHERVVSLSDSVEALESWLKVRPREAGEYVFCSLRLADYGSPLTNSGLHQMLRRLKKAAGITAQFGVHDFRHTYGEQYLLAGGDISMLSKQLGHSSVLVTARHYGVFRDEALREYHRQHSPLRRIRGRR